MNVKRVFGLATILGVSVVVMSPAGSAVARVRSCGELRGAQVAILHGPVKCHTARGVLSYALGHHRGNGPGSPKGWECFRIAGDPRWSGIECISPPGEEYPRNHIADRERL